MAEAPVRSFEDITERLDEIIATVRSKDTSLERSLDLFDEAIELGSRAVEMVDSFEMSENEASLLESKMSDDRDAREAGLRDGSMPGEGALSAEDMSDSDASSAPGPSGPDVPEAE